MVMRRRRSEIQDFILFSPLLYIGAVRCCDRLGDLRGIRIGKYFAVWALTFRDDENPCIGIWDRGESYPVNENTGKIFRVFNCPPHYGAKLILRTERTAARLIALRKLF